MNSIKWVQASAMMDVIAEKSCNLVGFADSINYKSNMEEFTKAVNDNTREVFTTICDILKIEKVEKN